MEQEAMALNSILFKRLNLFKLFRSYKGRIMQQKWYGKVDQHRICRSILRSNNIELVKRTGFKMILVLSHNPSENIKRQEAEYFQKMEECGSGVGEIILIVTRIIVITCVVTILTFLRFVTYLTNSREFPRIFCRAIEFLGPTFIKFGQWLSTRNDLFSEDTRKTLSQLQRNVSPHSWLYTKHVLTTTYGPNWENIFVKFDHKRPIGSGCCAQVYRAWINPDASVDRIQETQFYYINVIEIIEYLNMGWLLTIFDRNFDSVYESKDIDQSSEELQPVVVKVLHPGVKGQLRRDLKIIRGICKFVTYIVPELHWLSLTDCIDEFSSIMNDQVDMRLEATNLVKFRHNFSKRNDVIFPYPYMEFTHPSVLVESFYEGSPISDYLDYNDVHVQRKLAKIGIRAVLKMVFKDNFIHCDLHPGNILVQEMDEPKSRFLSLFWRIIGHYDTEYYPRLVILDCGLVVSLNDRCRKNLRHVFRSVLMGNGKLAAEYILQHSSHMTPDPEGFKTTMGNVVNVYYNNRSSFSKVNVSTVVTELFSAMVRHRVKQDGSFSSVILSMVVIEGLGRSLDPNIDIFTEVLPFVFNNTV